MTSKLPDFLEHDELGSIRLTGHRITLYHLLWYYGEGFSPEALHEQFPTVSMALIHKTLAFYWENKSELDAYVKEKQTRIDQLRAQGSMTDVAKLRERLVAQQSTVSEARQAG